MDSAQVITYPYTPVSSGVDWLTATRKRDDGRSTFEEYGNWLITQERAAGGDVKPATLRDYTGHRADGLFVGRRTDDSIIVLSGPRASAYHWSVTRLASNVSRLDLQVTLWTHGEQPRLALHAYRRLSRRPPRRGRSPALTYIERRPQGETLNYGSRVSDTYGRLYDKASEASLGPARTLWRFEVEYKRRPALALARALARSDDPATDSRDIVRDWWVSKGLHPAWSESDSRKSFELPITERSRDVLSWFRSSLSKTVATAVNRYGIVAVIDALGLSHQVQPQEVTPDASPSGRRARTDKHDR